MVFASLSTFLKEATTIRDKLPSGAARTPSSSVSTWFLAPSFASEHAFLCMSSLIIPKPAAVSKTVQCAEDDNAAHDSDFVGVFEDVRLSTAEMWSLDQLRDVDMGLLSTQQTSGPSSSGVQAKELYISVRTPLRLFYAPK